MTSKNNNASSSADDLIGAMSRRALLASVAVTQAAFLTPSIAGAQSANGDTGRLGDGGYFLSGQNPVANVDQKEVEERAIAIKARPDVQAAIKQAAGAWAIVTDKTYSPEQWALFDGQLADYAFYCILDAVNSDANFPKVVRVLSPAATWLGHNVPASKWGGDNPDNAYRDIPLEYGGRYVLHGQRQATPPADASYQLRGESPNVLSTTLGEREMEIGSDGSFAITLDETSANGRKNHLQLTPGIASLFVRDSMADWRQTPNALRIERVNLRSRDALTEDEIAQRAITAIKGNVYFAYWAIQVVMNSPQNTLNLPRDGASYAGLPTQVSSAGNFHLDDDQAAVITANSAGALYRSIVIYDRWNRSLDYRNHQSHLNTGFMAPNPDGRFTFVVSSRDPLAHNGLDTQGFHDFMIGHRWQGLPPSGAERPQIDVQVVRLSQLQSSLPPSVPTVTPPQRLDQIRIRQSLFDRRFIDA